MARRKKKIEEHVNHERWLVSYADFITLLFAFFVVMYSISSVNVGKFRVLSDTLEAVFTDPKKSVDPIQIGELSRGEDAKQKNVDPRPEPAQIIELPVAPIVPEETIRTINDISNQLNDALLEQIENDDVNIKKGEDWLELEIKSNVLFYSGESKLEKEAVPIIGKVADILRQSANPIQVEGFTDNQAINTPRFPSNWELSAARAASVVHLLDRYGLNPSRMSAIGYGEFKPIADNGTNEGRQKNRRVVLVVLGSSESRRSLDVFAPNKIIPNKPTASNKPRATGPRAVNN
jgi:chemotaxis protein MotB